MSGAHPRRECSGSLSGLVGFEGVELGEGLLVPSAVRASSAAAASSALNCLRLRHIRLARLKLAGEIPKALSRCVWLCTLELQDNWLRGKVPDTLGKCTHLETLALHGNALDGEVPADALSGLTRLATLTHSRSLPLPCADRTFSRTFPSDIAPAPAVAEWIAGNGWRYISVLYVADSYAMGHRVELP